MPFKLGNKVESSPGWDAGKEITKEGDPKVKQERADDFLQDKPEVQQAIKMQKILNPQSDEAIPLIEMTSKEHIEKAGQEFETAEERQKFENIQQFFSGILSFLKVAISYLNIFAYFKPRTSTKEIKQAAEVTQQPIPYIKATPEQLSHAAHRLVDYFEQHPEVFKTEGIFRLSASEGEKKKLFNELISSPEMVVVSTNDSHLITGVLKQVYRNLNLFGQKEDAARFLAVGLALKGESEPGKIIAKLKELVDTLPSERKEDLKIFIRVLSQANKEEATNKMTIQNLAIAAGPNLFDTSELADIVPRQEIAQKLITYYQAIFEG